MEHSQTSAIVIPWGLFEVERWALGTEKVKQTWKLVLIALAVAHNWYSGHHDPFTGYECGDNKDCRVISPRYVEPLPGNVSIRTGSKTRNFIPKNRVLEREDSQYHICTSAPHMTIRCFFAPRGLT